MKKMLRLSCATAAGLVFSLPAAAQVTWNYASTCAVTTPGATASCTLDTGEPLTTLAYTASSGRNYVAATLTNQGGSGIGMTSGGENLNSPNHAIDNSGNHELVLLNFGNNLVTLNSIATGWSNTDTDISILRWTGAATGPNLLTTPNMADSGLAAAGWTLVRSADLDLGKTPNAAGDFTGGTMTSNLTVGAGTSSSWWIISSYFGTAATDLDRGNDFFKLMSVTATCVSTKNGANCPNTPPTPPLPEPGSLSLAAAALFGLVWTRRRRHS